MYATGKKVRTRRWIWRQSDGGKIGCETKNLMFIIDGFSDNLRVIETARNRLTDILSQKMGCKVKKGFIDKNKMEFDTGIV